MFRHHSKMMEWKKNTGTAKSANARFAERHSSRETREANSNAARMPVAVFFKQRRRREFAQSALKNFYRLVQVTKHVPVRAELLFVRCAKRLTQWSKCGKDSPCSAAQSLQDVCGTRQTERPYFSGIQLRSCERILKRISSMGCRGTTMARGSTNGA